MDGRSRADCQLALFMVQLPSHHAELARQFKQGRSRVEFLGLVRELQTKFGVLPTFLGSRHGGTPPRKRSRGSRCSGFPVAASFPCGAEVRTLLKQNDI
jgi:hypothetical protein